MEKLIYKSRYENIEHWGVLMSHFSAVSLQALAIEMHPLGNDADV